jgi:hypothetical protein
MWDSKFKNQRMRLAHVFEFQTIWHASIQMGFDSMFEIQVVRKYHIVGSVAWCSREALPMIGLRKQSSRVECDTFRKFVAAKPSEWEVRWVSWQCKRETREKLRTCRESPSRFLGAQNEIVWDWKKSQKNIVSSSKRMMMNSYSNVSQISFNFCDSQRAFWFCSVIFSGAVNKSLKKSNCGRRPSQSQPPAFAWPHRKPPSNPGGITKEFPSRDQAQLEGSREMAFVLDSRNQACLAPPGPEIKGQYSFWKRWLFTSPRFRNAARNRHELMVDYILMGTTASSADLIRASWWKPSP